ncbi:hypothetical protein Q4534_18465 [Cyclobacterium sp. 1_MG-2023]|uniref:hypothetical protein n=1 Tax=Cyclobacterium sp. 1_MG-2023 TaxID=3062681 RepID=UPI0026E2CB91|nr:hypothetical protein [Cyclobacterium sp. 1_MG-2023]MDO6439415.1 hypothetical protein [Cyclobacterium sp. 1_MG-2023]
MIPKSFLLIIALIFSYNFSVAQDETTKEASESNQSVFYIKEVLQDGKGDFDPWNTQRWANWYNDKGELIRQFDVDTSVKFKSRNEPWLVKISEAFTNKSLFTIAKQGIVMDGNGLIMDVRTDRQKLPLDELYALKKEPWTDGNELRGIFYNLPQIEGIQPTQIKNFTFMGWKRGVKINGTGDQRQHRLIVENCVFARNRVGFYTNGYNTLLRNCDLFENGYGAIYSGSRSRRNQFLGNEFRDNTLSQNQHSYGDFIGDTFFDSEISSNTFAKSHIQTEQRRIGISMFRNMGESNNLREQMPHNNIIRGNHFDGYSVAIHIGSRMGRDTRNDITDEGRDYAFYNLIADNTIENSTIGIKINTEGNTISRNVFSNVKEEIVLQCVFFKLENITINYQKDDEVKLWYVTEDYAQYSDWFRFQDDLNGSIKKEEKLITVFSQREGPSFSQNQDKNFKLNPKVGSTENQLTDFRVGAPIATEVGEFSLDLPGQEFVAIYDRPISRIGEKDYYSILFFDDKGTEINRCGRSEVKWKEIATGYFTKNEGEMEVAAIPADAIDGKYPVFIFDRGFKVPKEILYGDNKNPNITIMADKNLELKVLFQ